MFFLSGSIRVRIHLFTTWTRIMCLQSGTLIETQGLGLVYFVISNTRNEDLKLIRFRISYKNTSFGFELLFLGY